jgi:hypothetical protein
MPILGIMASQISGHLWAPSGAYDSIATTTVGSGGASSITFSSIPSTYTHLQIRGISRNTLAASLATARIQINGDTSANYTVHEIYGDGSTAGAYAATGLTRTSYGNISAASAGANIFAASVIDILDYTNTNKYKTLRMFNGVDLNGSGELDFSSGLWMSTSAITSITLFFSDSTNFTQYSSFALYGIRGI